MPSPGVLLYTWVVFTQCVETSPVWPHESLVSVHNRIQRSFRRFLWKMPSTLHDLLGEHLMRIISGACVQIPAATIHRYKSSVRINQSHLDATSSFPARNHIGVFMVKT